MAASMVTKGMLLSGLILLSVLASTSCGGGAKGQKAATRDSEAMVRRALEKDYKWMVGNWGDLDVAQDGRFAITQKVEATQDVVNDPEFAGTVCQVRLLGRLAFFGSWLGHPSYQKTTAGVSIQSVILLPYSQNSENCPDYVDRVLQPQLKKAQYNYIQFGKDMSPVPAPAPVVSPEPETFASAGPEEAADVKKKEEKKSDPSVVDIDAYVGGFKVSGVIKRLQRGVNPELPACMDLNTGSQTFVSQLDLDQDQVFHLVQNACLGMTVFYVQDSREFGQEVYTVRSSPELIEEEGKPKALQTVLLDGKGLNVSRRYFVEEAQEGSEKPLVKMLYKQITHYALNWLGDLEISVETTQASGKTEIKTQTLYRNAVQ